MNIKPKSVNNTFKNYVNKRMQIVYWERLIKVKLTLERLGKLHMISLGK